MERTMNVFDILMCSRIWIGPFSISHACVYASQVAQRCDRYCIPTHKIPETENGDSLQCVATTRRAFDWIVRAREVN